MISHLRSLGCLKGRDHNIRFIAINCAAYSLFILNSLILSSISWLFLLINLLLLLVISATANRRVRDAQLRYFWQFMPISIFILNSFLSWVGTNNTHYFSLLLAIPATLLITIKTSAGHQHHRWGYLGPVQLASTSVQQQQGTRIEPTLASSSTTSGKEQGDNPHLSTQTSAQTSAKQLPPINDWYEPLRRSMLKYQGMTLMASGILVMIAVIGILYPLFAIPQSQPKTSQSDITLSQASEITTSNVSNIQTPSIIRRHRLEMPSYDYSLMLNQYNGLIIHWPSYDQDQPQLWSLSTGQGEQSCAQLVFNNGQPIRTLTVSIEDDGDYYVSFSPLDTQLLITGIAAKNTFSLCGYDFSLKGTRATISQSPIYSEFLL